MFKLLKNAECYTPFYIGKKDILINGNKIFKIEDSIEEYPPWDFQVIDIRGQVVCPGFLDQHLHITGGGGEAGPVSRVPEIALKDIITSGVTSVVGVLGVDGITRNIAGLLAKARSLAAEGLNTYIYTGNYGVPTETLTGKVMSDIYLIDKIIGVGEIAISDYRSSYPTVQKLKELAWEAKVGGMLGGKAGVMHIHIGDGKEGMAPLLELVNQTDFPIEMFVPTHVNRNKQLFGEALAYTRKGGNIDLTAGESSEKGFSVPDGLEMIFHGDADWEKVTVSSDGNGSIPSTNGQLLVGKVNQLLEDIRKSIVDKGLDMEKVLHTVTANVAKVLKLYPAKGALEVGSDADFLVFHKEGMIVDKVFIGGETFVDKGIPVVKGTFQ